MAAAEEVEYESDPEEAKLSLKMRRRVASDDEDEGEGREKAPRRIDSDVESDGQGAAPADYDDEEEEEEEYLEEEEELEDEEGEYEEEGLEHEHQGEGEREGEGRGPAGSQEGERVVEEEGGKEGVAEKLGRAEESTEADGRGNEGVNEKVDDGISNEQQREEEKKENEPYAVPTAGAFYMHDDRFRDNAGGRHRRTLGGRKLWESKDERKWGHDKFEELTSQERQYEEGRRSSRGRFRGRGRSRGALQGYSQGNRPKSYGNNNNQNNNNNNQNNAPKSVRGRGPRRYQPSFKNNNDAPPSQNKQSGKSVEKPSRASSGRATVSISDVESSTAPAKKQVFASSLNSASPPFYPSSSSNKDITSTKKRDVQAGTSNRNVKAPVADESFPVTQSNTMMRGKNTVDSIGMEKLYIDDSTSGVGGKPSSNLQFAPSGSSSVNSSESQHLRAQGRGLNAMPRTTYQPTAASNLVNRVSPPNQLHAVQRNSAQSRVHPSLQASSQQFAQHPVSGSQASSPPKAAMAINSLESGELESPSELSKSKTALVGKGKVNVQGSGRGLFLYGGNQAMGPSGNMNTGHGDQNFPAFLPVMQLGGQHPGGIGVPAVGMAFPGYVGNPQLGLGNSEMTWLPVLAGAAGALGATYCSPYFAVDGAYNARPSGQASAVTGASSKENNVNKPNNEWKPSQRPEVANDDFGLRQKNPRRYTEMKFDQ